MSHRFLFVSFVCFVVALRADPLTKQIEVDFGRDVASRNLKGLATRSDGRVLPGPVITDLDGAKLGDILWTLKPAGSDRFIVGTGPAGKVEEVTFNSKDNSYTVREIAHVSETQAIAVQPLPDGSLLVGTSPTAAIYLVKDGKSEEIEADTVLSAIGVVANIEGVLSKNMKVELDRNYVKVGDDYQTNVKGIYAAGDIIGPPWLAHVATFEAVSAVNGMFGHGKPHRVKNFPGCTYCQPQVASTGLTEKAAKEKKLDYKIGKFPFTASGKAVASAESDGFVKVISDAKTGEIYGAHIIGAEATELIAEYGFAIELEATVEEIHQTIHAHPTLSEAVMEAAAATTGEAIHI